MKISILQFKPELGKIEKNFNTALKMVEIAQDSEVLVLPELWSTGYYPTPLKNFADAEGERTKNFICELAKKFNVNIIAGSVIVESGGKFFNRCMISDRHGEVIGNYDKVHMFSFADEGNIFTAGKKFSVIEIDGIKCGITICYDLRFPEFIRKIALNGIEILFCPAAWSLKRLTPRQILTKARAIENQIFVVFANSLGKSEIINPLGESIAEVGTGEQILTEEIDFSERKKIIGEMNLLADRNKFTDIL